MAPVAGDDDINLFIEDVVQASKVAPKARATNIKPTVASLTSAAYDRGLLPDALDELIDLVTAPSFLDQASLNAIVRNLYPTTRVSRHVVTRVVACLGHGRLKVSLNIQAALIRWLILVYHTLESPAVLSQLYQVLFSLLDTAATRPQLSHLLALITRRKHVKPFRIQALLNLSRQTGNDPCLVGLLRVFKDYYPEIIVGEAVRGKASAFKHPDPQWRERLDGIQEAHVHQTQDLVSRPRDGFRVNRPVNRTQRNKAVPLVHTSHANQGSVTLEEVEDANSLAQNLDKLELPNQLVAVLADPLLQKLLLLRRSDEAYQRIYNWLYAVLQDVISGSADEDTLWDMLDVVKDFVTQTKALPPVLLNFFARFFALWGGTGRTDSLLDILTYTPFHDFEELYRHIFQPLEAAVLNQSPEAHLAMLTLYTHLLRHWTTLLQSSESIPDNASENVAHLIRHVNPLAQTILQASPAVRSESAILDFYEQSLRLTTDERLISYIRIELPPPSLVYTLFHSNCVASVSRLCHILAGYKKGFQIANATGQRPDGTPRINSESYSAAYLGTYNGFIMDVCNCLWRNRAFSSAEPIAQGCMVPRPTVDALTSYVSSLDRSFTLVSFFNLSHSPTLCYQSMRRIRELEDLDLQLKRGASIRTRHAGPATQATLARLATSGGIRISWQEYRIGVLHSLTDNGLSGIAEILKCTMNVVKNAMDAAVRGEE